MWVLLAKLKDNDIDVVVREVHFKPFHDIELVVSILLLVLVVEKHVLHALQREKRVVDLLLVVVPSGRYCVGILWPFSTVLLLILTWSVE